MNRYFLSILLVCCAVLPSFHAQSTTCDESYECDGQTITDTDVYCYGYYGCEEADITSTVLYAYGAYGTYLADITSTTIYAFGAYGAYLTDITATTLNAYGYLAGFQSTVSATYVGAHGFFAMHSATIIATNFYAYGYYSAYYADISPLDSTLNVYFYGYYTGYNADISCYAGDTCNVYCGSAYGCNAVTLYCYSTAICSYDCDDDPDYCPSLVGSGVEDETSDLYLSDITIKEIYIKNAAKKKKDRANRKTVDMLGVRNGDAHGLPPDFDIPHDIGSHHSLRSGKENMPMYWTGMSVGLFVGMLGMLGVYCYMNKQNKYGYMKIAGTVELQ